MKVVIIGAGMSGLSVGFMLNRRGFDVELIDSSPVAGGGAHSFEWNGHTCDWSTHRLFTHDEHTLQQLLSLVPMNQMERSSRVFLGGKWLRDPADLIQLCTRFFPKNTFSIPYSYLTRPRNLPEDSFQNYVHLKFGRVLEQVIFSPYTVKMFGIPADQISVEWARKKVRIAGPLDVIRQGSKKKFNYFYYPKKGGYGAIPERLAEEIRDRIILNATVTGFDVSEGKITGVRYQRDGQEHVTSGDLVISTMPLTTICKYLGHDCPLTYRGVDAVYMHINKPQTSPYHWIYYMDGEISINRLCEFKNFDPQLGPPETSVVCAEVTNRDQPNLEEKIVNDVISSGLIRKEDVLDTTTVTREFSYPVYCQDYEKDVDAAQQFLRGFSNLRVVGRAAQFEHMEIDDCFGAALQLSHEIIKDQETPTEIRTEKHSDLPVEPRVAAIVCAQGTQQDTLDCLDSVTASDYHQLTTMLVVDRTDEELQKEVSKRYPGVQILQKPEQMGIPAAFNLGINRAGKSGTDFMFLCLGIAGVEPDTISQLVRVAQRDPEAGILTPKILSREEPDCIWSIGSQFRKFPPSIKTIGLKQKDDGRFEESREVEFAVSSGLLVKRDVFERTGLFDPGYQFYYEDIDFSQRARNEGFRVRFVPEARMFHKEMEDFQRTPEFYYTWGQSFARYYRRHVKQLLWRLPVHFGYLALRESLTGNARNTPALCKGAFTGLHQRMGNIPKLDADFIEVI